MVSQYATDSPEQHSPSFEFRVFLSYRPAAPENPVSSIILPDLVGKGEKG